MDKPTQLSEQAIKWMQTKGTSITLAVIPAMKSLITADQRVGDVDESSCMIAWNIRMGETVKSGQSEYFETDQNAIEVQFENQLLEALLEFDKGVMTNGQIKP